MIVIDSSALIAMLQDEPERAKFASMCLEPKGISPHPSPLPMGEGVRSQPSLFGRPLSHGERGQGEGVRPPVMPPNGAISPTAMLNRSKSP